MHAERSPGGAPREERPPSDPLAHLDALWSAPVPLAVLSADGAFQRSNTAFLEVVGPAAAGTPFASVLRPADAEAEQALAVALQGGGASRIPVVAEPASGRRTFSATLTPFGRGGARSISVVLTDCGPDRYEAVLRQLPAAMVVRDLAGGVVVANERLKKMIGWDNMPPPLRTSEGEPIGDADLPASRALRGETVQGEELLVERGDGVELTVRVSANPIRDDTGGIIAAASVIEDVTVRRRLEDERSKLLSLLDSASDLIGICALDGRTLYMNDAGRRLVGLGSLEEALSKTLQDYIHDSDKDRSAGQVFPDVLGGNRYRGEVLLRSFATGEAIPLDVVAFAITDRAGKPSAIAAVGRDAREQRRAEAERQRLVDELGAKQRMLDAVLQQMPAGVVVAAAPSGALLFSNEQAERILRRALYPVEAGAPARLSIDGDGVPVDRANWPLHRALHNGESVTNEEIEVLRGDGTRAVLRCNAAPLRDGKGEVFAAIVVFDDITVAKRAERALLESEARFRRLAESGMIGVLFAEGDRITEANESFLGLIGRTRDELLAGQLRWSEVAASNQLDRDKRARAEIRERGFCKPFERDFIDKDGRRVPAVVGAAQLEEGRKAWVLFVLDDRERKRAEELQRQLMGMVSHDLRSPLSAVAMASSLLLYAEDLPERHVKVAARIHTSAEKMKRLIGDLLDYQQARVGRGIPVKRRPDDLGRICAEVVHELELIHAGRELRYTPNHDGLGMFDADRVSQVLQNLLTNAFHHSPAGTPVRLSWVAEGPWLRIEVHNLGPPIPPEFLAHMFQPFRRGQRRKDGPHGFGLGLFIVHEVVRAHGGSVAVESTERGGTTFTVRLPRA